MTYNDGIDVLVADASHEKYVDTILKTIADAAKVRGSGIASRTHEYVAQKMRERKAIIALRGEEFAGFCYIESWEDKHYVANSGHYLLFSTHWQEGWQVCNHCICRCGLLS